MMEIVMAKIVLKYIIFILKKNENPDTRFRKGIKILAD